MSAPITAAIASASALRPTRTTTPSISSSMLAPSVRRRRLRGFEPVDGSLPAGVSGPGATMTGTKSGRSAERGGPRRASLRQPNSY